MSFEVFLQAFASGEPAGIPRADVRRLFPVVDAESEPDHWRVRYDDLNHCDISVTALPSTDGLVDSLCVSRPCADVRLWDGLFEVMRLGNVVLYFPGDALLIATESARRHLPKDMVDSFGALRCVRSGQEIMDVIEHA